MSKEFALIVYGATGFTGSLVTEHLIRHYGLMVNGQHWAIGGRSTSKLEQLKATLTSVNADVAQLPVVCADSSDEAALNSMVRRTKVVINLVGPYALFSSKLVTACANAGTHYCDITGEIQWVKTTILGSKADAERTGARIVHFCGFDSMPSDIGTLAVAKHLKDSTNQPVEKVDTYVVKMRGGVSGGTIASMEGIMSLPKDQRKALKQTYYLNMGDQWRGPPTPDLMSVKYDKTIEGGRWIFPFLMAIVNTRVVRWAAALSHENSLNTGLYADNFRYNEVCATVRGTGLIARLKATLVTAALGLLALTLSSPFLRRLTSKFLPSPGEGPSRKVMERGHCTFKIVGVTAGAEPATSTCTVKLPFDPGYMSTAILLAESGLLLADMPDGVKGGVFPPSVGLGAAIIPRLQRHQFVFELSPVERIQSKL